MTTEKMNPGFLYRTTIDRTQTLQMAENAPVSVLRGTGWFEIIIIPFDRAVYWMRIAPVRKRPMRTRNPHSGNLLA